MEQLNKEFDISVGDTQTCSTYAYAITWRGAQALLKTLDVWDKPIDLSLKYDFCGDFKCLASIYNKDHEEWRKNSGRGIVLHLENDSSDIGIHTWIK